MIRLANQIAIPFFERIPTRAFPWVRKACDQIANTTTTPAVAYSILRDDLRSMGVAPPDFDEFKGWFEAVRLGRFVPADYEEGVQKSRSEPLERTVMDCAADVAERTVVDIMEQPLAPDDTDPAALALPVIRAAWSLRQALIAAGYSPESCDNGDQLVAEAIESWLRANAMHYWLDAQLCISPAKAAVMLLDRLDAKAEQKLLEVLATHMQAELMAAIVSGRAA